MAYNEALAERIRDAFRAMPRVEEKKMMGGLTFMVNEKMCVGIVKDDLMLRLDPEHADKLVGTKGCRQMDFTGKPMKGFIFVSAEAWDADADFTQWIRLALDFNARAKASPKKRPSPRKKPSKQ